MQPLRVFFHMKKIVLCVLLMFPCNAYADHNDLHSNTQAIEGLLNFFEGGDFVTLIVFWAVVAGFSVGLKG